MIPNKTFGTEVKRRDKRQNSLKEMGEKKVKQNNKKAWGA